MKVSPYIFVFLLLFSGCAIGPNFKKPSPQLPKSYRYAESGAGQDSIVNLDWWKLFKDAALDSLIRESLRSNKNAEIAYSRIEQARYQLGYTKADLWPSVGYQGGASHVMPSTLSGLKDYDQFSVSGNITWEIDLWGKLRRANEASREELFSTTEVYNGLLLSLITEVASNYMVLRDLDNRLEISKQTLKSRQEYFDIINQRYSKGVAPEWDLRQAEVQVNVALAAIPAFERSITQTENAISILCGRNPGPIARGKSIIDQTVNPEIPAGLPSQLLANRPDILAAEHQLAAQNARIGVAQAMRLPSISLTGMLGVASGELSSLFTGDAVNSSLSAGLFGPIFEFQKNKRRVDMERAKTFQAQKNYELTVINAFAEVENSLAGVKTYKDELSAREAQAKAAKMVADISRSRYDGGITSYLEVLDADRTNFEAQLNASATKQSTLLSYINLYKALGGGWNAKKTAKP